MHCWHPHSVSCQALWEFWSCLHYCSGSHLVSLRTLALFPRIVSRRNWYRSEIQTHNYRIFLGHSTKILLVVLGLYVHFVKSRTTEGAISVWTHNYTFVVIIRRRPFALIVFANNSFYFFLFFYHAQKKISSMVECSDASMMMNMPMMMKKIIMQAMIMITMIIIIKQTVVWELFLLPPVTLVYTIYELLLRNLLWKYNLSNDSRQRDC